MGEIINVGVEFTQEILLETESDRSKTPELKPGSFHK